MNKLDIICRRLDNRLYLLRHAPDDAGCPHFLSEETTPVEWEWGSYEPRPLELAISKQYATRITDTDIDTVDFDFYGTDAPYVSSRFLELCDAFAVRYRAVPIDITLHNGARPPKSYAIFLPASHVSVIDTGKSVYELDRVVESGATMMHRAFPELPVYSRIARFVPKEDIDLPHLFQCIELFSLVCTEAFRQEAIERGLNGLQFTALDENYIYDPWADW